MTIQWKVGKAGRGIEWADTTVNPIGGCLHDCMWEMPNGDIAECYAKETAEHGVAAPSYPRGFEHHYWRPKALAELVRGKEPMFKFVDSMSDMFGADVPAERIEAMLTAMGKAPHHTFQSLTKAHGRMVKFMHPFPHNLWPGVSSAPDWFKGKRMERPQQARYMTAAIDRLREVKRETGNITWMSLEPVSWNMAYLFGDHTLDWVVIGAASNGQKYFQPDPDHVIKLLEVFDKTNTPVFFKGNIKATADLLGIRFREDFPTHYHDGSPIPAVYRRQENAIQYGWPTNTFIEGGVIAPPVPTGQMALL